MNTFETGAGKRRRLVVPLLVEPVPVSLSFRERPILFSAPMVRSILAGNKTQTRRIVNVSAKAVLNPDGIKRGLTINPEFARRDYPVKGLPRLQIPFRHPSDPPMPWEDCSCMTLYCPHGRPGDRLWVKETFAPHPELERETIFRADRGGDYQGAAQGDFKWKPSIFMPRNRSRITLEITGVRVERLQDISEEDAKAEGVPDEGYAVHYYCDEGDPNDPEDFGAHRCNWRFGYKMLWNEINGVGSWDKNPWVWVIEFKKL